MPIIIFILIVILVAQLGFWDAFASVLGAIGVVLLLVLIAGLLVALTGFYLYRRVTR